MNLELPHKTTDTQLGWDLKPSWYEERTTPIPTKFTPTVGAQISTLKGMTDGQASTGLGRIGCFAVKKTARAWINLVLLSNDHVLKAHGARTGDTLYQPTFEGRGVEIWFDRQQLNPIATITGDGHDGPYRFAYPGERAQDYHIDCATAKLTSQNAHLGDITAFKQVVQPRPVDFRPNRRLPVRLLGIHDRSAGHVTDVSATVEHADGRICRNCIVIETLPGHAPLAVTGDSGALVVDAFERAIGLLWGVDLAKPTRAFACHLLPVLDCLGLLASNRTSVTSSRHRGDFP